MLDYNEVKQRLRLNWWHAFRLRVFDDAFHDTWADYLEHKDSIPDDINPFTWVNNRMWNNINRYEPYRSRDLQRKRTKNQVPQFIEMGDTLYSEEHELEDLFVAEDTMREKLAEKYKIPIDIECDVCQHLLQGYSVPQVTELLGLDVDKNKNGAVYKALKKAREED